MSIINERQKVILKDLVSDVTESEHSLDGITDTLEPKTLEQKFKLQKKLNKA